jgi:hypothetical protein
MVCLICGSPAAVRDLPEGVKEIECPEHETYRISADAWPRWEVADADERAQALGIAIRAADVFGDIVPIVVPTQLG